MAGIRDVPLCSHPENTPKKKKTHMATRPPTNPAIPQRNMFTGPMTGASPADLKILSADLTSHRIKT